MCQRILTSSKKCNLFIIRLQLHYCLTNPFYLNPKATSNWSLWFNSNKQSLNRRWTDALMFRLGDSGMAQCLTPEWILFSCRFTILYATCSQSVGCKKCWNKKYKKVRAYEAIWLTVTSRYSHTCDIQSESIVHMNVKLGMYVRFDWLNIRRLGLGFRLALKHC